MKYPSAAVLSILLATVPFSLCPAQEASEGSYVQFDAWRTSNRIAPFAAKGGARALHDLFLATYTRASDPYLGGEDLEQMCANLAEVAAAIGDAEFAEGLKRERPEIINSVRVIGEGCLDDYPKTKELIASTESIKLPIEYSFEDVPTPLMTALIKEEEG